ncbi:MAG: GAF domain-containing protein [Anaerolineae bacterium]|jgi:GAF domain-containing protein/HAMP domain-containing protein
MIDRLLRRLTVRSRIIGSFMVLLAIIALFAPLLISSRSFILGRLEQITEVEARADRLLLLASARIESSRVNTMRYIQDYAPSAYEALDDVDQASELLVQARDLMSVSEQQATVDTVLAALADYRAMIEQVEAARAASPTGEDVSSLLFQAYRLGNDIGQRIEQVVEDSEARIAAGNQAFLREIQNRMLLIVSGYGVAVVVALILSSLIQRSITRPVDELREGADAFRQGGMDVAIPVAGSDELSVLAQAFNQLMAQLRELIGSLEERVADRTRDLEHRAVQLATAADVGRAAASILDLEALTRQVVDLVCEGFDLYYAGLFLLDTRGRYAVLEAGTGEAGRKMKEQGHKLEVGGVSMVGAACAQRRARIALDVGEEPVRFDNPLLPETRSEMALPMVVGGQVLGALDVQSSLAAAFTEEDVVVLQLVADQVAVAIQNARLFATTQEALEAEREAYGEISRQAWREMIQGQVAYPGYTSDEAGLSPVRETAGGEGDGGNGANSLSIPIRVRDRAIGLIDAEKPEGAETWTREEISLLETLVEQLGIALEGARLYHDTQRRAARERLIGEVTARMRETLDVRAVLERAADEIYQTMGLDKVVIRLSAEGREAHGGQDDRSAGEREA